MSNCLLDSDLVILAASIAVILSSNLSVGEITILADLFCAIGDNLALIASKKEFCKDNNEPLMN